MSPRRQDKTTEYNNNNSLFIKVTYVYTVLK